MTGAQKLIRHLDTKVAKFGNNNYKMMLYVNKMGVHNRRILRQWWKEADILVGAVVQE